MSEENEKKDLISISKDLDKLAIAILTTLQSIILERKYLEDNLKEGYINMAKSRYLMRGQKISMLQVNNAKLVPSYKVLSCPDLMEGVEFLSYNSCEESFHTEDEKHLKRRSGWKEDLIEKFENTSINSEEKTESNKDYSTTSNNSFYPSTADPLKWFGVLVPESLRTCQSRFKQATSTVLKIASLQNQLRALGFEYRKLKQQKSAHLNDG